MFSRTTTSSTRRARYACIVSGGRQSSASPRRQPAVSERLTCATPAALAGPWGAEGKRSRSVIDDEYIRSVLWAQKGDLFVAVVCALVCTCSNLAAPVITGILVEILAGKLPTSLYPKLLGILAVMYTVEPLVGRLYVERGIRALDRVLYTLRREVFRVLLMQPMAFFDKHGATSLTGLLSQQLDAIQQLIFGNISRDRGLRALLEASGSILVLFYLSWRLAPVLSVIIVATGVAAAVYKQATRSIEADTADAKLAATRVAAQAFRNIRTVRAFAGENLERERFNMHCYDLVHAGDRFARAKAWLEAANRASIHASLLLLFAFGGWLVRSGWMSLGVMLTGVGFTFSLMYATQGLVNSLSDLRRAVTALEKIREILASSRAEPQIEAAIPPGEWWHRMNRIAAVRNGASDAAGNGAESAAEQDDTDVPSALRSQDVRRLARSMPAWEPVEHTKDCPFPYRPMTADEARRHSVAGCIELREVSFAYPMRHDRDVLHNVSFSLPRGTVTALVGRSGAGKSTVASLLSRFYAPDEGEIRMDGVDIAAWSRESWADTVALVGQEPVLFSASIADNIAYGRPRASQEDIEAAARAANAHDFISQLSSGYDTMVGERGVELSGGQRQRITIARALLKNAPVLILDEATSSLDAVSERLVSEAIARLLLGRTVLVIAHRLSTIQQADHIVVLDRGAVVEEGTHDDLLRASGHYADLVDSQRLALSL